MNLEEYSFFIQNRLYRIEKLKNDNSLRAKENIWEPWHLWVYEKLLNDGDICFDIGSNIGINTIYISHIIASGKIFCFEPIESIAKISERNYESNSIKGVKVIKSALGNDRKNGGININYSRTGDSYISKHSTNRIENLNEKIVIQRLDDFCRDNLIETIDFVKLDVEGYEYEVLKGGLNVLRLSKDLKLITEFCPAHFNRICIGEDYSNYTKQYFDILIEQFESVLILTKSNTLIPVYFIAQLLIQIDLGTGIVDLVCLKENYNSFDKLNGFIEEKFVLESKCFALSALPLISVNSTIVYVNRYEDGWSTERGNSNVGTFSGAIINVSLECIALLVLKPILRQHSGLSSCFCEVYINNTFKRVDLLGLTEEYQIKVSLQLGTNYVYLSSDYSITASKYFGNPSDPRNIGFLWTLIQI